MRKLVLILFLLTACGSSTVSSDVFARQWLDSNGKKDAKVTKLAQGNPKYHKGADELWCVETDSTTSEGRAYLVTIWRTGNTWSATPMTDDQYEWDLNGCPAR